MFDATSNSIEYSEGVAAMDSEADNILESSDI